MAGLQRSSQTFRRSGSSGLVWDERLMSKGHDQRDQWTSGELDGENLELRELRHSRSVGFVGLHRRRNDGAGHGIFHSRHVPPSQDPPSPKVFRCVFCGIFRKAGPSEPSKPRRY